MTTTLCVVIARGGSKGVPRKNLKKLRGKPLVAYSIEAALKSKTLDAIVLSTEDDKIAKVAEDYDGVEVIKRPDEYANDTAPIELVLRHAVKELEQRGNNIDYIVSLYGCVVILDESIIDKAVANLISTGADSVSTYALFRRPPQLAYTVNGDRVSLLEKKYDYIDRRQQLVSAYYSDGAVLALKRDTLMKIQKDSSDAHSWMGSDRRALIQSSEKTINVDEPIDFRWGEFLVKGNHTNNLLVKDTEISKL